MVKIPKLTKKALREYLRATPNKQSICGAPGRCVLASFYADSSDGEGYEFVSVLPYIGAAFYKNKKTAISYEPPDEQLRLPNWANSFAALFDNLSPEDDGPSHNKRHSTVLKRLGHLIDAEEGEHDPTQ